MNFLDFLNDSRYKIDDPVSAIINIKNIETLNNVINKNIKEVQNIGINIDKEIKELESINNSSQYEENFNVLVVLRNHKNKLEDFFREFSKKYFSFLNIYNYYQKLKNDLFTIFDTEKIDEHISFIIIHLNDLKEKEEFQNEDYTSFIYKIYRICYEYMLEEFIINKESKLYDYFISNEHDFWYINEFVKQDIEEITSSINIVFNYDKLKKAIERNKSNHFMYSNIIKELAICEKTEYYKKVCDLEFERFHSRFSYIHSEFNIAYSAHEFKKYMTKIHLKSLKQEFIKLKQEYKEFMKEKDFLKEFNEIDIKEIEVYSTRIEKYLKYKGKW